MSYAPYNGTSWPPTFWWYDTVSTGFRTRWAPGDGSGFPGLQNGPVMFTFSQSVTNFTVSLIVVANDYPTGQNGLDPGHYMVAYDAAGQRIDSVDFQVGVMTDERVLTARGIRKVKLYPVTQFQFGSDSLVEPVDHQVSFAADSTCPPSGDSVMDSPEARQGLKDALAHSNPNATPGTGVKKEIGGLVYKAPDGHFYVQEVPGGPLTTECVYDPVNLTKPVTPLIDSSDVVAQFHTHPSGHLEATYGCGKGYSAFPGDGKFPAAADPDDRNNGGGSPEDWKAACSGGGFYPVYVITKTGNAYRLDCSQKPNKKQNPNKWHVNGYLGCPVRFI